MDVALAGSSFAKHLASCNKSTRDKALRFLNTWLASQNHVSNDEMIKIWKGLFYCVWHADKQSFQIELINRLSSLLVSLDLPLSIIYFEVFITTMRREWSGIDYLRLDKFYLLIRRFLHHFFLLLKKNSWDLEVLNLLMGVLEEKTLLTVDKYPAQGVNYHISEIFLEELKEFLPVTVETLDVLLKPFFSVLEKSQDKVLLNKIKVSIFNCLLENGKRLLAIKNAGDVIEPGDEVYKLGTIALTMGLSTRFFNSASSSDSLQGNRKVLFGLREGFLKLEKDLEKAGIEMSMPEVHLDTNGKMEVLKSDDLPTGLLEVPSEHAEVVPVFANGSADKPSKKSKKAKKASKGIGKNSKTKKNGLSESIANENISTFEDEKHMNGDNLKEDLADAGNAITFCEAEKASKGIGKKTKTKKNGLPDSIAKENISTLEDEKYTNGDSLKEDLADAGNAITFSETVISNLQKQFEKVAAEAGMETDGTSLCSIPTMMINNSVAKKRKRAKSMDGQVSLTSVTSSEVIVDGSVTGKSGEKSAKRVRFSMKNNLVWKPHSPLPPQSLRLPPSATPRGSALKQGVPPGPIRELPAKKLKKRVNAAKKARKSSKSAAIKRLRKLQTFSV
ncbi:ribosomal RNA processing-like protein [Tasmannia lanceolata]|uniref:ribosomal RNA processing-like protein n=1 Tax=Tasmannia lanceolata TaxID=3420 RepID=UPI004063840D